MRFPDQLKATGALYAPVTPAGTPSGWWQGIAGLVAQETEVSGWTKLTLTSGTPLAGEVLGLPEYTYHFLHRQSGGRFLLVSSHTGLDEKLIAATGGRVSATRPTVDIPKLVKELTSTPGRFVMSALWARVEGFGQALRAMSLYGNDLATSALFVGLLPQLVPHRLQLRDVATRVEIVSIASRGEVGFTYSGVTKSSSRR